MSTEAITCEELKIHNVNEKTAAIAAQVGEYLLKTWGIERIKLKVDDMLYESNSSYEITQESELYQVCRNLAVAEEIYLFLRSANRGGPWWRLESCFMAGLTDDEDIKNNITYRSTDYFDTDSGIVMHLYNENGLQNPGYTDDATCIADIEKWYSYTPVISFSDEDQADNEELHDKIMSIVRELYLGCFGCDEDVFEDAVSDDWADCGEIIGNSALTFSTADIPKIVELVEQLTHIVRDAEIEDYNLEIYAVPCGENDYDFASVAIYLDGDTVKTGYCRF